MKKKNKMKVVGIILAIILIIGCFGAYKVYSKLNKFKKSDIEFKDSDIGIKENLTDKKQEQKVVNYLLLGVDKEENATDAIIVVSLNKETNKIKMVSLLRDIYIDMGPDKVNKLNYAYHYGGPVNTMKVINETFGLNIRDYALVNFESVENIVDAIGGVNINLTEDEVAVVNSLVNDIAIRAKKQPPKAIKSPGNNTLNGFQALAYSRIRKIDSDFKRTDRQRTVINALLKKVQGLGVAQLDKFTDVVFENTETSLSMTERLGLIKNGLKGYKNGIEEAKIPIEGTWESHYWDNGAFYFTWDKEKNVEYLKKYIYK